MSPSQTWNDVRIEKEHVAVSITMFGGEALSGSVFAPQIYPPGGVEEPLQLLNEAEPFFPLGLATGEVLLIAKHRVLEITLDESARGEELPGKRAHRAAPAHARGRRHARGLRAPGSPCDAPTRARLHESLHGALHGAPNR